MTLSTSSTDSNEKFSNLDKSSDETREIDATHNATEDVSPGIQTTWHMAGELQALKERDEQNGEKARKLGVTWQNLTVKGVSSDATFNENVLSQFNLFGNRGSKSPMKTILDNSHGCVKPGEMLLVLGCPGSGCTTLLNVLSNNRRGYAEVSGDIAFGNMSAEEAKQYRGQIIMNSEEEIFFPTLTVGETIDFAARMKVPSQLPPGIKSAEEYAELNKKFLLRSVGISHTESTKVGDAFTRGVSGGEKNVFPSLSRKWHLREFRQGARPRRGKQIFYGPQRNAVPFMENLGFRRDSGSNRADFLTGVTVPTERIIALGYESKFPRTSDAIRAAYESSSSKSEIQAECSYPQSKEAAENTAIFKEMVKASVTRQYQIMWGDKATLAMKQGATVIQALLGGSLFYNAPDNSIGLFLKGGALFFSILYNALIALSEVTDSFTGRPILAKHRSFALYHPAAICISQIVADFPILLFQVSHFGLVLYFMVGLNRTAEAFFTYWITNFMTAMSMTALFRLIGAAFPTFDAATKVSGLTIVSCFVYTGYMIIKPEMHPWFVWLFWINPMAYGFEALLGNEFHSSIIPCVGPNLIPNGPGYTSGEGGQSCAGVGGASPGATSVTGREYLASMSFSHSHVWRNFGIICAWWVLFVALTIFFTSRWKLPGEGARSLLVPREQQYKSKHLLLGDEESQVSTKTLPSSEANTSQETIGKELNDNRSIFTWKNLTYTVKTSSGDRVLLDNVQGYVKPGMLGALMGSSGAGKTTLLDVLAQRKTDGTIHGSVLVDGRPIPISFQRSAGYVEQLDVHESLATVREALEFSALLRQPRDTPTDEKLRYVDTIIDLLELRDLEFTLVGRPGAGLSVEQRKRLTIAVELVAKPSILIFLDEPTSGLDGQAAFNIVRFLRKLAEAGQAVLVTIHQPSAQLFAQFNTLLLLAKGGKTVYFGDIGDNASTVKAYFARHGAPCPPEATPAEHMIDVVSGAASENADWNKIWLESPEHDQLTAELDAMAMEAAAGPSGTVDDGHEFAASMWTQVKLVTHRMNVSLFRNTEYIDNKFALHISLALLNGFSFWMIGDRLTDLQKTLFTVFNFIFVAPGVIS
ncbi:hypothetical protein N7519_005718 [Penicillium mononematosum]|uniref:uncharacterized protein n=1 Tax=Penicillium mononematosum TaxID=268346 RepID=UPI0025496811|nr:uncharacterized protein N7519_005718 [Penicillium mononematosum]KAJ6184417.1 hypothetical protein N7519_005718 [Penicillium mononematosum]